METPTLTGPEVDATKYAMIEAGNQRNTAIALSWAQGTPFVYTPIVIPTNPPAPTPISGIGGCGGAEHSFSCADGYNRREANEFLFIESGTAVCRGERCPGWLDRQGFLRTFTTTLDRVDYGPYNYYTAPVSIGALDFVSVNWPRMTLITDRSRPTPTTLVFNWQTRGWEESGPCELYPIAIQRDALLEADSVARYISRTMEYGTNSGNFGWLTWNGDMSDDALITSLTAPGDSFTYDNPDNPADHSVSVGDWVLGRPEVSSSPPVEVAFASFATNPNYRIVAVPVWDQTTGQGSNLRYHISGFAWIYAIQDHSLAPPNRITLRYWGPATCSGTP
jgi:hypothetical protein